MWPENWRAWELFTQLGWNAVFVASPMGGGRMVYQDLKWERLEMFERLLPPDPDDEDVPDTRTLVYQLRTLEQEAREHLNLRD